MQSAFGLAPIVASSGGVNQSGFLIKWNNAVLSAVFGMLVGTGGIATANARIVQAVPTGPAPIQFVRPADAATDSLQLLNTQEKLAGVRRYLSMNVTDMARALRVRRPTVYSWLRDDPSVRATHAHRLDALYRIARAWRGMSQRPIGQFLRQQLTSGTSLIDLLSTRSLDEPAIRAALSQIHEVLSRTKRPSILDVAKKQGLKLSAAKTRHWASDEGMDL